MSATIAKVSIATGSSLKTQDGPRPQETPEERNQNLDQQIRHCAQHPDVVTTEQKRLIVKDLIAFLKDVVREGIIPSKYTVSVWQAIQQATSGGRWNPEEFDWSSLKKFDEAPSAPQITKPVNPVNPHPDSDEASQPNVGASGPGSKTLGKRPRDDDGSDDQNQPSSQRSRRDVPIVKEEPVEDTHPPTTSLTTGTQKRKVHFRVINTPVGQASSSPIAQPSVHTVDGQDERARPQRSSAATAKTKIEQLAEDGNIGRLEGHGDEYIPLPAPGNVSKPQRRRARSSTPAPTVLDVPIPNIPMCERCAEKREKEKRLNENRPPHKQKILATCGNSRPDVQDACDTCAKAKTKCNLVDLKLIARNGAPRRRSVKVEVKEEVVDISGSLERGTSAAPPKRQQTNRGTDVTGGDGKPGRKTSKPPPGPHQCPISSVVEEQGREIESLKAYVEDLRQQADSDCHLLQDADRKLSLLVLQQKELSSSLESLNALLIQARSYLGIHDLTFKQGHSLTPMEVLNSANALGRHVVQPSVEHDGLDQGADQEMYSTNDSMDEVPEDISSLINYSGGANSDEVDDVRRSWQSSASEHQTMGSSSRLSRPGYRSYRQSSASSPERTPSPGSMIALSFKKAKSESTKSESTKSENAKSTHLPHVKTSSLPPLTFTQLQPPSDAKLTTGLDGHASLLPSQSGKPALLSGVQLIPKGQSSSSSTSVTSSLPPPPWETHVPWRMVPSSPLRSNSLEQHRDSSKLSSTPPNGAPAPVLNDSLEQHRDSSERSSTPPALPEVNGAPTQVSNDYLEQHREPSKRSPPPIHGTPPELSLTPPALPEGNGAPTQVSNDSLEQHREPSKRSSPPIHGTPPERSLTPPALPEGNGAPTPVLSDPLEQKPPSHGIPTPPALPEGNAAPTAVSSSAPDTPKFCTGSGPPTITTTQGEGHVAVASAVATSSNPCVDGTALSTSAIPETALAKTIDDGAATGELHSSECSNLPYTSQGLLHEGDATEEALSKAETDSKSATVATPSKVSFPSSPISGLDNLEPPVEGSNRPQDDSTTSFPQSPDADPGLHTSTIPPSTSLNLVSEANAEPSSLRHTVDTKPEVNELSLRNPHTTSIGPPDEPDLSSEGSMLTPPPHPSTPPPETPPRRNSRARSTSVEPSSRELRSRSRERSNSVERFPRTLRSMVRDGKAVLSPVSEVVTPRRSTRKIV